MNARTAAKRARPRLPAVEVLLPLACLVSAMVLGFSELSTTFEFTPPGGEPLDSQSAADRHSYALLVLALFAIFALAVAVMAGSRPAAFAVAAAGGLALLIFLLNDLPDAGQVGTLDDPRQSFFTTEAVPQSGFWLELIGALGLAVAGAALATLTPEQLALGERFEAWRERRARDRARPSRAKGDGEEPKSSPKRRRREESEKRPEQREGRVERVRRAATRRRGGD